MVLTFQGWRFQRWRQTSLWIAKKIRRQRIRDITRRRSESNARGTCRIIVGNSTSRFCTIESHWEWFKKTRKLCLMKPRDIERRFFTCEQLIQRQQRKGFLHRIVTGDEKWIFYDNPKKKKYYSKPGRCHRPQHQHHGRTFMVRRSCSVSGGTKRVLFMNCWNLAIPLRTIGIGYNWFVWAVHCEKNGRNTSKDMIKLFFFMTTLGLMLR